jgi:fibronectin type 3 domain-containing protein
VTFPESGLLTTPSVNILKPSQVTAQLADAAAIRLTWSDNAVGEQGYVLERRSEEQSAFQALATLAANTSQYTDAKVVDGVTYAYRIKAVSAAKPHSGWSDDAVVDLPLLAPTGLTATTPNRRSVALRWEDRSAHETAYIVEKAEQRDGVITPFKVLTELRANSTTFTDTKAVPGLLTFYRVVAKDADEVSAYSNQASIRTTAGAVARAGEEAIQPVALFPNPAADLLTISPDKSLAGPVNVQIFTLQGTLIKTVDLGASQLTEVKLDVSGWQEGIYIVHITSAGVTTRQQLLIQH